MLTENYWSREPEWRPFNHQTEVITWHCTCCAPVSLGRVHWPCSSWCSCTKIFEVLRLSLPLFQWCGQRHCWRMKFKDQDLTRYTHCTLHSTYVSEETQRNFSSQDQHVGNKHLGINIFKWMSLPPPRCLFALLPFSVSLSMFEYCIALDFNFEGLLNSNEKR